MVEHTTEELLDEAATELSDNITEALNNGEEVTPSEEDLSTLQGEDFATAIEEFQESIDVSDVQEELAEAQKWFLLGQEADGFDDDVETAIEQRIEELEAVVTAVEDVNEILTEELVPAVEDAVAAVDGSSGERGEGEEGGGSVDGEDVEADSAGAEDEGDENDGELSDTGANASLDDSLDSDDSEDAADDGGDDGDAADEEDAADGEDDKDESGEESASVTSDYM